MTSGGPPERVTASTDTSHSLLLSLKASDPDAWDRLVHLYSPLIYYWCQRMGLPEQEIPDVFQEVFQAVARSIESFRQDQASGTFRGWLRTVTRNKVRDYYRKAGREPHPVGGTDAKQRLEQVPFLDSEQDDGDDADQSIYPELFERALANVRPHFHPQTWQAFWRVVVDGQLARDVAVELSMQPGTVRVAKSRVLHRLRLELGDVFD